MNGPDRNGAVGCVDTALRCRAALVAAWRTVNYVCGKRLVPFLPELIPALERHGHLSLSEDTRARLLEMSAATADRIFRQFRLDHRPHGKTTTKSGQLLKHGIPIRTFADWEETRPGFMEADLVAHGGANSEGPFLHTLVLTDVATGWTECLALLRRTEADIVQALATVRQILPFQLVGLDTDNGSSSSITDCSPTARVKRFNSLGAARAGRTTSVSSNRRTARSSGSWSATTGTKVRSHTDNSPNSTGLSGCT